MAFAPFLSSFDVVQSFGSLLQQVGVFLFAGAAECLARMKEQTNAIWCSQFLMFPIRNPYA